MNAKIDKIIKCITSLKLDKSKVAIFYLDTAEDTMKLIYGILDEVLDLNVHTKDKHIDIVTVDKDSVCTVHPDLIFHISKGETI